jgi:PTS system mannose-specific IID component
MFIRTFFIQALWNFERMQNIGFLFVLKPFIDKIYLSNKKKKKAMLRHIGYFNTHPYMSGLVIAIVANIESKIALSNKNLNVNNIKNAMSGPLAAIGDPFFSGTIRSIASFISIFLLLLFTKIANVWIIKYGILIPFVFIIFYNIIHISVRYWLMFTGFKFGKKSIFILSNFKFLLTLAKHIDLIIVLLSSVLYLSIFDPVKSIFFSTKLCNEAIFIFVFLFSIIAISKFSVVFLFYTIILICALISYLGI